MNERKWQLQKQMQKAKRTVAVVDAVIENLFLD
jgi:hypothetical protein